MDADTYLATRVQTFTEKQTTIKKNQWQTKKNVFQCFFISFSLLSTLNMLSFKHMCSGVVVSICWFLVAENHNFNLGLGFWAKNDRILGKKKHYDKLQQTSQNWGPVSEIQVQTWASKVSAESVYRVRPYAALCRAYTSRNWDMHDQKFKTYHCAFLKELLATLWTFCGTVFLHIGVLLLYLFGIFWCCLVTFGACRASCLGNSRSQ